METYHCSIEFSVQDSEPGSEDELTIVLEYKKEELVRNVWVIKNKILAIGMGQATEIEFLTYPSLEQEQADDHKPITTMANIMSSRRNQRYKYKQKVVSQLTKYQGANLQIL